MFGLIHNLVVHPVCGIMWFVADTIDNPRLAGVADRLHSWEPRKDNS